MMEMGTEALLMIKIVLAFFFLFVLLPSFAIRFDRQDSSVLDRVFIPLIHSSLFLIISVHILVTVKIYETISLFMMFGLGFFMVIRYNGKSMTITLGAKMLIALFDFSENRKKWTAHVREQIYSGVKLYFAEVKRTFYKSPYIWSGVFALFITGSYICFHHSIHHLFLASSDTYGYVVRSKLLGSYMIYNEGVFPYGLESIISAISTFFLMDPYFVVRFIGPLAGSLIMLSIIYAARKLYGHDNIALIVALFLYVAGAGFTDLLTNKITASSLHYAAIFFLPGIVFFILYFRRKRNNYLLLAGETLAISFLVHVVAGIVLVLFYVIVWLAYIKQRKQVNFRAVLMIIGGAISVGMFPLLVGLLAGKKLDMEATGFSQLVEIKNNMIIELLLFASLAVFLRQAYLKIRLKQYFRKLPKIDVIFFAAFIFVYLLYISPRFNIYTGIPTYLVSIFLALITAMLAGRWLIYAGRNISRVKTRKFVKLLFFIFMAVAIMFSDYRPVFPKGLQYQYDEAVQGYLRIKEEFPVRNWNIVSPVEEFSLVYGYGWHTNIWEFAHKISDPSAESLIFTTDHIFFFVEKTPIGSSEPVRFMEASSPFPDIAAAVEGEDATGFYYRNAVNRRILQAKVYAWAENYRQSHKNMKVYYESEKFIIYYIHQDRDNPVNLLH